MTTFHNLCSSPNMIRMIRSKEDEMNRALRKAYRLLGRKARRMRPIEKPIYRRMIILKI